MFPFKEIIKKSNLIYNEHYLKRYFKFIDSCSTAKETFLENHHILPVSIFPEYKKVKENIKKLTPRQHFIAHWILAKAFGGSQWFSFNQMKRIGSKSILYHYGRKYIVEQIKLANTGREKTKYEREEISKRTKNTVIVQSQEGKRFRISKDDPRYISGELRSYRVGYRHNEQTINKMRKNKPWCFGMTKESSEGIRIMAEKNSRYFKKTIWVTIENNGLYEYKRILPKDYDEKLHLKGRKGFEGFRHINSTR